MKPLEIYSLKRCETFTDAALCLNSIKSGIVKKVYESEIEFFLYFVSCKFDNKDDFIAACFLFLPSRAPASATAIRRNKMLSYPPQLVARTKHSRDDDG